MYINAVLSMIFHHNYYIYNLLYFNRLYYFLEKFDIMRNRVHSKVVPLIDVARLKNF